MVKCYSIKLKYGTMIKNLYFEGDDSQDAEIEWENICNGLTPIGDNSSSASEFIENVVTYFSEHGFQRIAK